MFYKYFVTVLNPNKEFYQSEGRNFHFQFRLECTVSTALVAVAIKINEILST